MKLLIVFYPFAKTILVWLVISQAIAWMISGSDRDQVVTTWMDVFLLPILLAILLVSWLQMLCKFGMYESLRMMTLWQVDFKQPSPEISDYLP